MPSPETVSGTLVLTGSEGVGLSWEPTWKNLLAGRGRQVELVAIPDANSSMVFQTRISMLEAIISRTSIDVRKHDPLAAWQAVRPDNPQSAIVISTEKVPLATQDNVGTEITLDNLIAVHLSSGGIVITGATAAAALGTRSIEVVRPLPANPDDAAFESMPGSGLVSNAAVLPYFDALAASSLNRVRQVLGNQVVIIGIDQNAALEVGPAAARCIGLGNVTLMRDNDLVWMGQDGDIVPDGLISLNLRHYGETP